jgi:hypothetical protein
MVYLFCRYAGGDAAGVDIWDTARGPAGQYWDVPRAARSLEAGNRFVLQPDRGHAFGRVPIGLRAPQEPIAQASYFPHPSQLRPGAI